MVSAVQRFCGYVHGVSWMDNLQICNQWMDVEKPEQPAVIVDGYEIRADGYGHLRRQCGWKWINFRLSMETCDYTPVGRKRNMIYCFSLRSEDTICARMT